MKSSGLFRIGRDVELRYLDSGVAVANVSLACNYGKKGADGNRPTQWIEGTLFDKRAETLAPMLHKGAQHVFHLADLHIETFQKDNGTEVVKLKGRIEDVELTDRPPEQRQAAAARPAQLPAPARKAPAQPASGFDDIDGDVPW